MSRSARDKKVKEALAIHSLDGLEPSEECLRLLDAYVEGNSTIEENKEHIIKRYLNKKEDKPV